MQEDYIVLEKTYDLLQIIFLQIKKTDPSCSHQLDALFDTVPKNTALIFFLMHNQLIIPTFINLIMNHSTKQSIAIIGGGASSLLLAALLNSNKYDVSIYEKNNALGRKFLVAGDGGFNLTHAENINDFTKRYSPSAFMENYLRKFSNEDLRHYLKNIGVETYVGSSKRVFPVKNTKPIEVLNAFEKQLIKNKVKLFFKHEWKGFTNNQQLLFDTNNEIKTIKSDVVIFSLGGASWKITGSTGNWLNHFQKNKINTFPFEASNCAYKISHKNYKPLVFGAALKNCVFSSGEQSKKGEAVITKFGIEGSGIYPLSQEIRKQLKENQQAYLHIDFKPDLELDEIKKRIITRENYSIKDVLAKKINLTAAQIELIKNNSTKEEYNDALKLSKLIKQFCFTIEAAAPIDEAISSVGGIDLNEITTHLELKKIPNHYCIGEMLNWDAPTGGYLLQACFSMAFYLANHLNNKK